MTPNHEQDWRQGDLTPLLAVAFVSSIGVGRRGRKPRNNSGSTP